MTLNRRAFLQQAAVATGGILLARPFEALAADGGKKPSLALGPVADLRDGRVRLHLRAGFKYRSFHDNDGPAVVLPDGTTLPGRHDGMGAYPAPGGNIWLVRNHEVNGAGPAFGPGTPYDPAARGGTTTVLVTPRGEVLDAFTSLNGTQMNCSGGRMPWGTWISCEETVNGPDVGPDFTGAPNVSLTQPHGFIFEVPAGGQSTRQPITSAGRFLHEAAAYSPDEGILYLTEDNFESPSGLYRYVPPTNPLDHGRVEDGGRLEMLRVVGHPNLHLEAQQVIGATYAVDWVEIDEPAPTFPYTPGVEAPTSNDAASTFVGDQGRAQGAASFSRLEGATFTRGEIYFTSTQGGGAAETGPEAITGYGNGTGQVWSYNPRTHVLTCRYQSPNAATLELPDNITARNDRGTLILCEDGPVDNYIRALNRQGQLSNIALNRLTRNDPPNAPRFGEEFAGATFSPDGGTLFVNIQANQAVTFAIWGPWGRLGV